MGKGCARVAFYEIPVGENVKRVTFGRFLSKINDEAVNHRELRFVNGRANGAMSVHGQGFAMVAIAAKQETG